MQQDSDWLYLSLDPMTVTYKVIYSCHMPRVLTTYVVCASCRLPNYAITSISSNRSIIHKHLASCSYLIAIVIVPWNGFANVIVFVSS